MATAIVILKNQKTVSDDFDKAMTEFNAKHPQSPDNRIYFIRGWKSRTELIYEILKKWEKDEFPIVTFK